MCFHLCHYMGQIVDHILKDYAGVFDFSDRNIYHSHQKNHGDCKKYKGREG